MLAACGADWSSVQHAGGSAYVLQLTRTRTYCGIAGARSAPTPQVVHQHVTTFISVVRRAHRRLINQLPMTQSMVMSLFDCCAVSR